MYFLIFIILVIIYSSYSVLAKESENCDCDLQVTNPEGSSLNFTKQNDALNGKPYYCSMNGKLIYWDNKKWSYYKYNYDSEKFVKTNKFGAKKFSIEKMCKNITQKIHDKK